MKKFKKALALLLSFSLVLGMIPASAITAFGASEDALTAALAKAKTYTDAITINNSSNDPATVVKNFGTHFTWDNEKRESSKSYLFDWSYYNGVVFEGIEYLYETTGEEAYKDYVVEYMSSLIKADGTWATCSNNSSKQCAGYNSTHGADCYKTASLLLDLYEMEKDSRYLTMAKALYADLDTAATKYSLSKAGANYRHTWSSDPTPDLWLDGLYMILPFRAEYAKHINDTEELDLIVNRMQWVSDNMYDSEKGLFYHAADSASSNSGTYWLRSIGWYAAAIVDIMDSMEGKNLEAMKAQLVKLVDGMKACQNATNGMWLNNMAATQSTTNPYETSGTALVSYAVMKAVNEGWLDESYADMATLAFEGICNEKLSGTTLKDICFKGAPGDSNSTFYSNEGKGVGPFIMLYAEVQKYVNNQKAEEPENPETPTVPADKTVVAPDGTELKIANIVGDVHVVEVTADDKAVIDEEKYAEYIAYDMTASLVEGESATISIPVPAEWDATEERLVGLSVEDGKLKEIKGTFENGIYSFDVNHFSAKGVALSAETAEETPGTIKGNLKGATTTTYKLVNSLTDGKQYLIVSRNTSGDGTALGSNESGAKVTVETGNIITNPGDATVWTADESGSSWSFSNGSGYLGYTMNESSNGFLSGSTYTYTLNSNATDGTAWTLNGSNLLINLQTSSRGIWGGQNAYDDFYVVPGTNWSMSTDSANVYFYKKTETESAGAEVTFKLNPMEASLKVGNTTDLSTAVTVDGTPSTSSEITWTSSNSNVATVDANGKVTAVDAGEATITATLTKVNGTELVSSLQLTSKITVSAKEVVKDQCKLEGDEDVTIIEGQTPDFSKLVLTLTYDDESTETITANQLSVSGYDINSVGTQTCTVSYNGEEYGKVTLVVKAKQVSDTKLLNPTITVVEGDTPNYSNVKYVISYDNGTSETFTVANGLSIDTTNYKDAIGSYVLPVSLDGNEFGSVTVNVVENTIASAVVTGNAAQTIEKNGTPDYSDIELVFTYKDGSVQTIDSEDLKFTGLNPNAVGLYNVAISYGGQEYGSVNVTVTDSTFDGNTEATEYPTYPADGAVRIKKTAEQNLLDDTGAVRVELDVAGVSVRKAVDVVLVADISNSMAWKSGSKNTAPGNGETTKWQDLQASACTFIDTLLAENEDGTTSTNTVSFVTFGGYDAERNNQSSSYTDYFDATQTVFTSYGATQADNAKSAINSFSITGTDSTGYKVTVNNKSAGTPQGGTNYDYAFLEAASAIEQIKADYATNNGGASYDESNREIYVLFMTDGAPDHYNQLYYKSRSSGQFDYNALYRNGTDSLPGNYFTAQGALPTYNNFTQHVTNGYYMPNSGNVTNANWIKWIQSDSLYAAEQVAAMNKVHSITAIGFDLANGAFSDFTFGESILEPVLANLAGENSCDVLITDNPVELNSFYEKLAKGIRLAGTSAVTTDIVDSEFTVQMFPTTGSPEGNRQETLDPDPTITITAYDLYTKADTTDTTKIGTRTGTSSELEKITFTYATETNEAGKVVTTLTGATSSVKEGNILTINEDGSMVIEGKYFTYYRTADSIETFEWNIGNITDKEVALSYYAYLEGSMEGTRPKGKYYTNEGATLEYLDINGNYAKKDYPMPAVVWGGAVTAYEFYLVNEQGQPCDRQGNVIPFANRIIITGPYYQDLYLNDDQTYYCKIEAAKVLPVGYTLYDNTSYYEVRPASGTVATGELIISNPASGKTQSTIEVGDGSPNYIQSHVAFGVMYNELPENAEFKLNPDQVVIDYGKSIKIDTMTNNTEIPEDYTAKLVGFTAYTEGTDLSKVYSAIAYKSALEGTYGSFSIADENVVYTPSKMVEKVEKIFTVVQFTKGEDEFYMVDRLYVIPATTMYYETDFPDVFTLKTTGDDWSKVEKGAAADGPQGFGTIGVDQTYGFDKTYNNDEYLSNGSSWFVKGQGIAKTTSEFSFVGTGFDLISRTGAEQGAIRVDIYEDAAKTSKVKSVTVLNKSESNLELYQIPVVSVNDLTYGKYYVTVGVNAAYNSTSLPALNRGAEFYFDAIRIYNPTSETIATDAYKADGEYNMSLIEVRNQLINANDYDLTTETPGVTFVDNIYAGENEDGKAGVNVGTYSSIGPNNEVYLANNQAIVFKIKWTGVAPTSIDIGAKSITGGVAHMKAYISGDLSQPGNAVIDEDIQSSTVQFKNLVNMNNAADFSSVKEVYVFVTNTGEQILSITDVKVAYGDIANTVGEVELASDEMVTTFALRCMAPSTPEEDIPEVVLPNYDIISADFTADTCKLFGTATMKVVTTQDVEKIKLTGVFGLNANPTITSIDVNEDGQLVWTIQMRMYILGTKTYTVIGYGEDGTAGAAATDSIRVKLF